MNAVVERNRAAGFAASGPAVIAEPSSPSEVIQILRSPKRFPSPVRPLGSGSATTRCVSANSGTVLDMSKMDRVLGIESDRVTVQPGIRLAELAEVLHHEGLELVGGFDLANRSVGGAVCSAGPEAASAGDVGQFAGHVLQMKVVSPQGKKFVVTENTKSLLALMRLSYGLLGVVYEITLRVRPVQGFSVQTAKVSFKDFAKLAPRLAGTSAGVKLHLLPFCDRIYFELRRSGQSESPGKRYAWRFKDWAVYTALPGAAKSLARMLPIRQLRYPLIDNLTQAAQSIGNSTLVKSGSNAAEQSGRFRALGPKRFSYSTWAFPAKQAGELAAAYKLFSKEHYSRTGFRCDMPTVAFRLNQDRSSLLSPSFDGPMLTLSPLCTQPDGWEDFVFDFSEFAMANHGVPLFNQSKNATTAHVASCFGSRLAFFNKVRRELDPHDRLLNQYFGAYLS
jgi:hypothetical protein